MKKSIITSLFIVLMSMIGVNVSASDIEVANTDGITIYYNRVNSTELAVTYGAHSYAYSNGYLKLYSGNVVIPESVNYNGTTYKVTSIDENAFRESSSLYSVTIPNSVTSIGDYAFCQCSSLVSVAIGNGLTSIGERAFRECSTLTSITIPSSVTTIGDNAFYECNRLNSVHISDMEAWCKIYFVGDSSNPLLYAHHLFLNGKLVTDLVIPGSVTEIMHHAFEGCSDLFSVNIGNNVTSIRGKAFYECSGLTSVTIPGSVTSIGKQAFYGCFGLTSVTIGNGVKSIGTEAFWKCRSLTSVTIPDGVTSIGNYAFIGCSGLTSVTIGSGVTSIGYGTFSGCSNLTSVTIPCSVTSIGEHAFSAYSYGYGHYIPNHGYQYDYIEFSGCSDDLVITVIVNDLNDLCNTKIIGLIKENIHRPVKLMDNKGSEIKEYIIPNNVTSIGENAFYNCRGLTSITIPSSVTSIGTEAFGMCSSLTSVTIPNSVTSIGESVFRDCDHLTSVIIPNSVTSIGQNAFSGCTNLKSVTTKITEPYSINNNVFTAETYRQATLYIPAGTEKLYTRYDGWREFLNIVEMAGDEKPIYLTIQNGASGRMKLAVKAGNYYTWQIQPPTGVEIKSVYFNDQDVTSQLDDEKFYTTPPIKENSTLKVVYEGDPSGSGIDGDANGDGEVNVADVDYIIERIK